MENVFESKIKMAMKKIEGKSVKVTISGIIESKFYMKNLKYVIEEGILAIDDGDNAYLDVDIDDIENLYYEFTSSNYILLVMKVSRDLQIEIQTKDDNIISIGDKILRKFVEYRIAEAL